MSDSDSDDNIGVKNGNYKSPSKRKRQKGDTRAAPKTYQFNISLSETNGDDYTEVSYLDLVAKEEQRLRKLAIAKKAEKQMSLSGLDPYASDDDDKLKKLAAELEAKYAEKPKKKGGKKRKMNDYDHLGEGYDESDPFIDNSECFDEVVPQEITTAHGGFYINTGALEFKENKKAVYNLSSDEEDAENNVVAKKVKKPKKEPIAAATKKQVKFKDEKPAAVAKKKPKIKNTGNDAKRKARIVNTDPNIKGPGAKGAPPKGDSSNVKKVEPKKIEMKKQEMPRPVESSHPRQKSPEKSVPKPPEIIDLEAQLMALSKDVELSKSDSKAYGFSKPSSPAQKAGASSVKSSPSIQELKLPPSVRVTKVEKQNVAKDVPNSPAAVTKSTLNVSKVSTPTSAVNVSKVPPTASVKGTTTSKGGWHNQVSFSPTKSDFDALLASKDTKPTQPPKSIYNSANNKKNASIEAANAPKDTFDKRQPISSSGLTTISSSPQTTPKQPKAPSSVSLSSAASAAASMPMFSAPSSISPASMFQHDPKNILASTVAMTTMSSILGTTAPYFAQKLQQKSAPVTETTSLTSRNPTASSHSSKSEKPASAVKNTQSQGSYTSSASYKASPSPSGGSIKAQSPLNLSTAPSPGVPKPSPGLVTSQSPHHSTPSPTPTALPTNSYPYQQKQNNQNIPHGQATQGPNRAQVPEKNLTSHNAGQAAKIVPAQGQIGQQSRGSSSSSSVLSAEMTKTLLLQAEHMMSDMAQSVSSPSPTSLSPSVAPPPKQKQTKPPAPTAQQTQHHQQQQQQQSYISQFQNFASQQQQVMPQQQHHVQQQSKKSSSYGISDLLNSQPLPQPSTNNTTSLQARQGGGQAVVQGRSPVINQQQQQKQVNLQQQQQLQKPLNLQQHSQPHAQYQQQNIHLPKTVSMSPSRASPLSSSSSLSSVQSPLSIPASPQPQTVARSQPQIPNFSSQQLPGSGMPQQQQMTQPIVSRQQQQQQQSVSRQQQQQQQQQQQLQQQQAQALLQQFNQYNYLGGY